MLQKKMWNILEPYNLPKYLLTSVKVVYSNTKISIISIQDIKSNIIIQVKHSLHHGCSLSPLLFDLYLNKELDMWKSTPRGIYINYRVSISTILFAVDQVLLEQEEDELQRAMTNLIMLYRHLIWK